MAPQRIDPSAGFFQMGMDSVLAARGRVLLEAGLGRKLPAPVMFEHPSVEELPPILWASPSCTWTGNLPRPVPSRLYRRPRYPRPHPRSLRTPRWKRRPTTSPRRNSSLCWPKKSE
ncbi:acyl carrier protein [Streptomyces sp. D2-8]|uniref:acyl carrier protein n=1 Tax=Streptomyces sp. D2-8 TaxID=2707767 RepID=UPI0035AD7A86|nr:acyl carrier protein [Streptomyces sp. D2-8]